MRAGPRCMRPRRSVLVLGNDRPSLTIVRTLAKKGFHVVLGLGHEQEDGARHSRHVHEIWHHPRIETDDGSFAAALDDLLTYRPDIRILYPVTEAMLRWTAAHGGRLPGDVLIASPPAALVDICLDRRRLAECATLEGVPCQPSAVASSLDALHTEAERLGYPVVVRPFDDLSRLGGKTAVILERPGDLVEMFPAWPKDHPELLVQRFARGERRDLYFAADRGKVLRVLEARIVRTNGPNGRGLPVEGEIVAVSPRLKDYAGRIARRLNYTGIGCARFLVDPVTDDVSLLAIDPHVAGGHECTEAMGMDLTRLAVSLAAGTACHQHYAQFSYEPGWRYSWIYGDLIALKAAIETREIGAAQAARWLARTVAVFVRADFDLTWDRRDPWPTLRLLANEVPGLLTGLVRRWASVVAWHPPVRRKLRAVG